MLATAVAMGAIINSTNTAMGVAALVSVAQKGAADGVASLGPDGKVLASQLPDAANADWNATSGSSQILNKPQVGTTTGTIAAGDDVRFVTMPTTSPAGSPPDGQVFVWVE